MKTHYNDYLLQLIRRQLWSIATLSLELIQQSIVRLIGTGCEEELMYLLREAILGNKQYAFQLSYIELIDRLLYFPCYNHLFHKYLIQFYTDVFIHLSKHAHWQQIGKIKVIRKYWVGRISPVLYYHLGRSIADVCRQDADDLPIQALLPVKNYFANVLRMPETEIMNHIPTFYNQKTIFHQLITKRDRLIYKVKKNQTQQSKINDNMIAKIDNPLKTILINKSSLEVAQKRIRYPSVQTNSSNDSASPHYLDKDIIVIDNICQTSPKTYKQDNQLFIQVKSLFIQLNSLFSYSCKQCGLKFITKDNHDSHSQSHIRQRLLSYKQPRRYTHKFNRRLFDQKQWSSNVKDDQYQEESIVLMRQDQTGPTLCCFCKEIMQMQFTRQKWLIKKAVRVQIQQKSCICHKSCLQTFVENDQSL